MVELQGEIMDDDGKDSEDGEEDEMEDMKDPEMELDDSLEENYQRRQEIYAR